ncbi:MAG: mandelate racemase/muconate lactonizing enzyme family protein [Chloroflexi bacterium]|nr:mandelate racemase/muconate lactonizing enzyme family protein [Chloroflexota bacterium]
MKVTSVDIYDVGVKWRRGWNPVIIRVNTDEGISGLGEAGVAVGGGHNAYVGILKDLTEMHLIGADPMKSEKVWENMLRRTSLSRGGGPVIYAGMSAIDIALWDIRGKAMGVPVHQLLGGKTSEKIRAYASQVQNGWTTSLQKPVATPQEFAEEALKAVAEGFDAIKVDPVSNDEKGRRNVWDMTKIISNGRLKLIYQRVEAVRKAVGPDIDIILETHAAPGLTSAIQIGRAMEDLGLMYYEEPVSALNVDAMVQVAQSVKIPIAAGEHLYTRWGYRQYLEKQALQVIQPDLCVVGGITEGKKICDLAHTYDAVVQCHCCGSPVTMAAALHLEAVVPNFIIHEHVYSSGVRENLELVTPDLKLVNGYFSVPEGPGLGIELNEAAVAQYPHFRLP